MWFRIKNFARAVVFSIALLALSGGVLWADPSDCAESATGVQTGDPYQLIGQSTVTVELEAAVGGDCFGSAGGSVTETYNVGYYKNTKTGHIAKVNCASGRIIDWL